MKPNVFRSSSRLSGDAPNAATAIEGSTKQRFLPVRMTVLERIAGDHASMSSITNNFSNAPTYSSNVGIEVPSISSETSASINVFFAKVQIFRA